jgi:hypothetical protein
MSTGLGLLAAAIAMTAVISGAVAQRTPTTTAPPTSQSLCVDVKIGDEAFYSCLNDQLRRLTEQGRFSSTDVPIGVTSPPNQVGTFNQAATAERLGTSFGHSVIPQRPPPPVFTNPLVTPR